MKHAITAITAIAATVILVNALNICVVAHDPSLHPVTKATLCASNVAFIAFWAYVISIIRKHDDHR